MNQGKLEVVKQEMARVNIDILGISKLKWTGMGEFNSDHCIYYCGQESLRRNGVALIVNKRVQNVILGCNLSLFPRQAIQYHLIQVYAPTSNAEAAEVELCRLTRPSRTNTQKRCPFITGESNVKV